MASRHNRIGEGDGHGTIHRHFVSSCPRKNSTCCCDQRQFLGLRYRAVVYEWTTGSRIKWGDAVIYGQVNTMCGEEREIANRTLEFESSLTERSDSEFGIQSNLGA
jgi:hypothetical protein